MKFFRSFIVISYNIVQWNDMRLQANGFYDFDTLNRDTVKLHFSTRTK